MEAVKLIECPRDAWQGLPKIIPTARKVAYLRRLIELGFRNLDAVSFVSPKYVPQMADSEAVMGALTAEVAPGFSPARAALECGATERDAARHEPRAASPQIIGIVVNERGLERALATPGITTIGYPHSISARFLEQNAHLSLERSRALLGKIKRKAEAGGRNLVVYLSMAFGNPYGEPWRAEFLAAEVEWLKRIGVKTVSLADTAGVAEAKRVSDVFGAVRDSSAGLELGVHLHSRREQAAENVLAAYEVGCRRFDCALTGLGGCPFAGDELVGNIPTEVAVGTLSGRAVSTGIESWALLFALEATREIRSHYL